MKRLQVKINDTWEYVFCRNQQQCKVITTADKTKAIKGDNRSLEYFKRYFGDHEFRIL